MIGDTIVALASAPGRSERAVIRVSGPAARAVASLVFEPELPSGRGVAEGTVRIRGGRVPAMVLQMLAPKSYTGEDTVELHVPGGPLLVEVLIEDLLARGAGSGLRLALPGEFTARACRNGRLDAAQVEGVLMLLHAADQRAAARALPWLRGGLADAVREVRGALQDALAGIEAGLDFTTEELGAAGDDGWRAGLPGARDRLEQLVAELPAAAPGGEILLLGAANAGKSSLCNALAGRPVAIVDPVPGTTRDLLRVELPGGGVLWDAPGDLAEPGEVDAAALALRDRLAGRAGAAAIVLDAAGPRAPVRAGAAATLPVFAVVWTRCDLVAAVPPLPRALLDELPADVPVLQTSAANGSGLDALRRLLAERAHGLGIAPGAPLRAALAAAAAAVQRAMAAPGPEFAAVDLQSALQALDDGTARHSPEDLLDRIYSRFCLGK